jgi:predicted MFS family arabinose efflux permease
MRLSASVSGGPLKTCYTSAMQEPNERFTPRQWATVLLIGGVQFVNILDFVIVMPMGPEFARHLGIAEDKLGVLAGSYTAAASLSGVLGAFFLDRYDRRKALAVSLLGLVLGTTLGGFAYDEKSLLVARVIAGVFGGPATSLSFSIIADVIPSKLRGRAMGTVMAAFALASVVGIPIALWASEVWSWRAPFFAVAGIGVVVGAGAVFALPPMVGHLQTGAHAKALEEVGVLLSRPLVLISYAMTATVMLGGFILIPNIAAYLQLNLGMPRADLKFAYFFGGIASFFATQVSGRLVDALGSFRVSVAGAVFVIAVTFFFFFVPWTSVSTWLICLGFVGFMSAQGLRNVAYTTLTSKVPEPHMRARFQSLQSAVQHGASSVAAFLSSLLLQKGTRVVEGSSPGAPLAEILVGMPSVSAVTMFISAVVPVFILVVERSVREQQAK